MRESSAILKSGNVLFYLLLGLFLWLPLPLGSNRPWALAIMEVWVFGLSIAWLLMYLFNRLSFNRLFFSVKVPLFCFVLFITFVFLQSISLPLSFVGLISPHTAAIYQDTFSSLNVSEQLVSISLNPYASFGKVLETVSYFLIFVLVLLLVDTQARLKILVYALIISGVAQAVYGTIMTLSGLEYGFFVKKEFGQGVASGTFVNRNHFAAYLEMCLALGIGVLISTLYTTSSVTRNEFWRRFIDIFLGNKIRLRIGLAIMVIALVSSHSRMGNAAFFFSMSLMGLVYLFLTKKAPKNVVILFVSLLIIDVFIVGNWFGFDKLIDRFEKTHISIVQADKKQTIQVSQAIEENKRALQLYEMKIESNTETRDEVYRDTITMIKANPLFGTGGGTYVNSFLQYRGNDIRNVYDHTHNDYLEFLAEYGFAGTFILFVLVAYSLVNAIIAMRLRRSSFMQGIAFASAMGILSILIHSFSDFNLQIPANAALFVVLLALANISRFKRFKKQLK